MGIIDELFSSALPAKSINDGVYQAQSHPCPQLYVLSVLTSSKIQIVTINNGIALHRVCCSLFLWHRCALQYLLPLQRKLSGSSFPLLVCRCVKLRVRKF